MVGDAIRIVLFAFLVTSVHPVLAEDRKYPGSREAVEQAVLNLAWENEPKVYRLAGHGQYQLANGLIIVRADSAREYMFLTNGVEHPKTDAVVVNPSNLHQLIFSYFEAGYVPDDDWSQLDPDSLLEGIIENTEESNLERIKNGFTPLRVLGWHEKPSYEKSTQTVYWAIKAGDGEKIIINAIALKLGRKGFSRLTAVIPVDQYLSSDNLLRSTLNKYEIEDGFRYADYSVGDKIAAVGLASLVAVTAGSKNGKGVAVGIMATLLIFAKKLWFLMFLPFIFAWNWIKRSFKSGSE